MAEIHQATAAALGWPKSKYAWVEHERRWHCRLVPLDRVIRAFRGRGVGGRARTLGARSVLAQPVIGLEAA